MTCCRTPERSTMDHRLGEPNHLARAMVLQIQPLNKLLHIPLNVRRQSRLSALGQNLLPLSGRPLFGGNAALRHPAAIRIAWAYKFHRA